MWGFVPQWPVEGRSQYSLFPKRIKRKPREAERYMETITIPKAGSRAVSLWGLVQNQGYEKECDGEWMCLLSCVHPLVSPQKAAVAGAWDRARGSQVLQNQVCSHTPQALCPTTCLLQVGWIGWCQHESCASEAPGVCLWSLYRTRLPQVGSVR